MQTTSTVARPETDMDETRLVIEAVRKLEEGAADDALNLAAEAIRRRPFNPEAFEWLGAACLGSHRSDLACRVLEQAVAMAPASAAVRRRLERARLAASVPGVDIADRSSHPEIEARVGELLADRDPTLGVVVVLSEGDHVEPGDFEGLTRAGHRLVVVDATRDGAWSTGLAPTGVCVVRTVPDHPEAEHRNMGLGQLESDWVLFLDSGDVVEPQGLEQAMRQADVLAHMVVVSTASGDCWRETRLVRNAPGVRFHAGLDDDLYPAISDLESRWGLGLGVSSVRIRRASKTERRDPESARRDLRSLDGHDDRLERFAATRRAAVLLDAGEPVAALTEVARARKLWDAAVDSPHPLVMESLTLIEGRCLMRLERYDALKALVREHHARFPTSTGTLFLEGLAEKATGDAARASAILQGALDQIGVPGFCEVPPELSGPALANLLGASRLDAGDLTGATEAFRKALELGGDDLNARLGLLGIEHAEGQIEDVLRGLDSLVESHGDDVKVWLAGAIVLSRLPALASVAVDWLTEAHRRFPDHAEVLQRLVEAQLQGGSVRDGLQTLNRFAQGDGPRWTAARLAGALACDDDLPDVGPDDAVAVSDHVLEWFRRWATCGALENLDRALMNLDRAETTLPGLGDRTAAWLESIGQPDAARGVRQRI